MKNIHVLKPGWSVVALGCAVVVAGIAWNVRPEGSTASPSPAADVDDPAPDGLLRVRLLPVHPDTAYSVLDRYVGEIEAGRRSLLGFELPGTLSGIEVDEGDAVRTDGILARLETSRLEAALREQRAALDEALALRTRSAVTFERVARLAASGAVAEQERDDALQQRDASEAAVARARAAIERIEVDLEKSVLRAPYDGTVLSRRADEGTILGAGEVVLEILEDDVLEARVGLPGDIVSDLHPGDPVTLRATASGSSHAARVARMLPQQDRRTRLVDVLLTVEDTAGLLPGDLVSWEVGRSVRAEGFWVPRAALTESVRGLWSVYVVEDESGGAGRLERREVELVHHDGSRAYVRGALRGGERIVADGLQRIVPGQRVAAAPELHAPLGAGSGR